MGKEVFLTRRERFNAAHKLWNESWSEEKNFEIFGKCANPNWHGHNYQLFVTVKGVPAEDTGYCVNLKDLSNIIQEKIIDKLDHKNLNLDVPFMSGIMTTTENVIVAIWDEIVGDIANQGCTLHALKLVETENNYAEYYG
jgi:6-pyruvoyltetrahydropterin/6-carboxytetrahydropterin synthase